MIDLRSDVKALPSPQMLQAMIGAELGDDVFGEDPTINALQARCAELTGKQAALFVTSGTQGNLVSVYALIEPGEELICHELAHIYHHERGGMAAVCGALVRPLPGHYGMLDLDMLADTLTAGDLHRQRTGVVTLENTHNACGGTALTAQQTAAVAELAHHYGVPVHLDAARIFNAAAALGVAVAELVEPVDTLTLCFSKGLGAPAGSMVCGPADFIEKVQLARKLFGGGMRQVGILGAAAMWALEHNVPKLPDDHRRARQIAETLAELPGIDVDLDSVQTNMVYFLVNREDINAPQLCDRLAEYEVKATARDERKIRFVTHVDVTDQDAETVCTALREILT